MYANANIIVIDAVSHALNKNKPYSVLKLKIQVIFNSR